VERVAVLLTKPDLLRDGLSRRRKAEREFAGPAGVDTFDAYRAAGWRADQEVAIHVWPVRFFLGALSNGGGSNVEGQQEPNDCAKRAGVG